MRESERKKRLEEEDFGGGWGASVVDEAEAAVEAASDLSVRLDAKTAAMRRMGSAGARSGWWERSDVERAHGGRTWAVGGGREGGALATVWLKRCGEEIWSLAGDRRASRGMDLAARREKLEEEKRLARLSSDHPAEERRGEAAAASARTVRQLVTERERRRQRRQRHRPPTAAPHTTQQRSSLVSHLFLATYPTSSRRPRWPLPSFAPIHLCTSPAHPTQALPPPRLLRDIAAPPARLRGRHDAHMAPSLTCPLDDITLRFRTLPSAAPARVARKTASTTPLEPSSPFPPVPSSSVSARHPQRDTPGTSVRPPP